jgi:ribonucleoside-diphosphate reductase alpha chain
MIEDRAGIQVDSATTAEETTSGRINVRTMLREVDHREARSGGLTLRRVFSSEDRDPFEDLEWETREAEIKDDKGNVIFTQPGVQVPKTWSMLATNIIASKYFYGDVKKEERESSLRQLIHRVTRTIADWGLEDGYFETADDAEIFYQDLSWLCVNQYGAFNSPVWFNCGLYHQYGIGKNSAAGNYYFDKETQTIAQAPTQYEYPQCSACFIQSVDDTMESIMELARSEAMLFKFGSGTGTDLSTIRSCKEKMSGGGAPSGPLSFLRVYDSIAGVVKSGGKTRRAAKMNTLKVTHPDIREFIEAKKLEEKKAWALIEEGYAGDFNGEAYGSICFQNENLSIRVTDAFMNAVIEDKEWETFWVTDPDKKGPVYRARDLMRWIAEGTWVCGDPGVQFEDTIQYWHTSKNTDAIHSSNPCSEYMFLNDSACNLASLNLMKFRKEDGEFDVKRFRAAVDLFVTAQEIIVDRASYPTERIALNSHLYRPLGLGYANLGALLMSLGLPYDSDEGRSIAGALTAIMHFEAYAQSARIAGRIGPFDGYEKNREPMLEVIERHRSALLDIHESCPDILLMEAAKSGNEALSLGRKHGYRNAQVTVLAPTGTIGFMMDCDTTGVEPDIALVKYKTLAGGGMLKIVNRTVPMALKRLGYEPAEVDAILEYINQNDTIEGAPHLQEEHLPVFDCAFRAQNGTRYIAYTGHVRMMASVQPFLSGAISKTVNMPEQATVEEIMNTYIEAWKMGLKAIAIYRDGCKRSQPLNTGKAGKKAPLAIDALPVGGNGAKAKPLRKRMPTTRQSITHKFDIAGHEGYLTVGLYDDGSPGELFITMAKEGSTIGGLMDSFGTAISMCLQYGVQVKTLVEKFAHSRFEPSGFTKNPDIPIAKSLMDYIFRWLGNTFLDRKTAAEAADVTKANADPDADPDGTEPDAALPAVQGAQGTAAAPAAQAAKSGIRKDGIARVSDQFIGFMEDAPPCDICGSITVRNGACYKCFNCGNSMGCS